MFEVFAQLDAMQITMMVLAAILIGINKTAVPGLGVLPVMMLAAAFESRLSTGIQLGMLAMTDVMAVAWYRRHADWKILLRLLPWALVGIGIGSGLLRLIPADDTVLMRRLIGALVLGLCLLNLIRRLLRPGRIPSGTVAAGFYGSLLGVTTQIANAAGPVASIYFLAMKLPKDRYMGTSAWFFLMLNWIKLPIFVWEGRITMQSVWIDLGMLPVLIAGAALGILLYRWIPQKLFNNVIQVLVAATALKLMWC